MWNYMTKMIWRIMHVYITSAVLKNELSFNRRPLVEAINRAVGRNIITDIRFH